MAEDLIIRIGAESKQFQEELDKIAAKTADTEDTLANLAKVSGVAFAALTAEAGLAIHAFAESEAASNKLSASLQAQGIYSEELADNYREQAKELQALTGIDDDAIIASQALLQNMIGQTEITPELSAALVELSTKTGSLESAAQALGKGIEGNTGLLKRNGIEIDDNLSKQERMAQIIEKVTGSLGGQAEAANKGIGSIQGLKSAFGDFQEAIGERLAPVLTVIIQKMTTFFESISENKSLVDLIVSLGAAAAGVSGLVLVLATGAIAFLKIQAAIQAAGIAMNTTRLAALGLAGATGIGLILVVVSEIALNWNTVWPRMQAVFVAFVNNISALAGGFGKILMGIFNPRSGLSQIKEGFAEVKAVFSKGLSDYNTALETNHKAREASENAHQTRQNVTQKRAADRRSAERRRQEQLEIAARRAQHQLLELQQENASTNIINLKKKETELLKQLADEKNKADRSVIQAQLNEVLAQLEIAQQEELDKRAELTDEILAQNQEFQNLTSEQQQQFLEQNQSQLLGAIETDRQIRNEAALKRAQEQIKANNQFLIDQAKFGKDYALINKLMHNEIFIGSRQAFGELAQLTQSSNSTLKSIGKVAAVANIIIKTAESAMNIYAGFSTIPIIGPALGVAGAAAAVAFGAEQIGRVTAAQEGGIITGGIPGVDSVPSLLTPGELVVPTKNFSEVVNAVAAQRSQDNTGGQFGINGAVGVAISFEGQEAEKVITARQVEARALGTYRSRV